MARHHDARLGIRRTAPYQAIQRMETGTSADDLRLVCIDAIRGDPRPGRLWQSIHAPGRQHSGALAARQQISAQSGVHTAGTGSDGDRAVAADALGVMEKNHPPQRPCAGIRANRTILLSRPLRRADSTETFV